MNHCDLVLKALTRRPRSGITQQDVLPHGVFRLAARIYDLREQGINIETLKEESVNQYGHKVQFARYRLARV